MMVYLRLSIFLRDVLDEILDLIESVSEGFYTYSYKGILHSDTKDLCFTFTIT